MVLVKYFFNRFFKYFFIINISLTLLLNFIEFFEKIIRIQHTTNLTILNFILLNLFPSFFETLPLSCWLATCLFLKELAQQNEWETLQILNVNYKKLFNLFFIAGAISATFSFIGKEKLALELANKSEKFKLENLKQNSQQKIINKWFTLSKDNLFCHVNVLDLKSNIGTNLTLIYMTPNFELQKVITAPIFNIDNSTKNIILPTSTITKPLKNKVKKTTNQIIKISGLFSQLQLEKGIPSLIAIIKNLNSSKNVIPPQIWNDIFYQLLKRIIFHIQIILYPLLTFSLFLLFFFHPTYKWIFILLPYPLITLIDTTTEFFIKKGVSAFIAVFIYLLLILTIFIMQKKLAKCF